LGNTVNEGLSRSVAFDGSSHAAWNESAAQRVPRAMEVLEMTNVLDEGALKTELAALPGWEVSADGKALQRKFKFSNFSAAFGFMTRVALLAEAAKHHPDWSNSYDTVFMALSTHSAGGITSNDVALARSISALLD
jgi:4a-hydroxytetrahydrobiopterin dehydratase